MNLLIQNACVVDPTQNIEEKMDVLIQDSHILDLGQKLKAPQDCTVINAQNLILAPGFIDVHTHLREPGFEYKEDIESGSKAAVAGGYTAVCCMANTSPVNDCAAITLAILERARQSAVCKVYPIGSVSKNLEGKNLSEMARLKEAGCVAFSDDGHTIENAAFLRKALEYAKNIGLPIISHALCPDLMGKGVMHEGAYSSQLGLRGIPSIAESVIIAREIEIAEYIQHPIHFAHVSTKEGVELIRAAKKRNVPITAEVSPHHFSLTDAACIHYDPNTKMAPPLRSAQDVQALKQALKDGVIDVIATDHAPHALSEKELGFDHAPFGIIGLETALSLSLKLVEEKILTLTEMVRCLSSNPAKIFNLKGGNLKIGSEADLVLFDPAEEWTYNSFEGFSKSSNTPFHTWKLKGKVKKTWVNAKEVYSSCKHA